jgi:hypothetical protein
MSLNLVQKPSNLDMFYVVELQKKFCDSTDVSQRHDSSIIFNLKMFIPIVLSRIKESDKPIGFNINGRQVATFAAIAGKLVHAKFPIVVSPRCFVAMIWSGSWGSKTSSSSIKQYSQAPSARSQVSRRNAMGYVRSRFSSFFLPRGFSP